MIIDHVHKFMDFKLQKYINFTFSCYTDEPMRGSYNVTTYPINLFEGSRPIKCRIWDTIVNLEAWINALLVP